MRWRILSALVVASLVGGCATLPPGGTFKMSGVADLEGEQDVLHRYSDAIVEVMTTGNYVPKEEVTVLLSAAPEGLEMRDGVIRNVEGYQHKVIGTFTTYGRSANTFWFADYKEGWRKGVCYPQTPLTWVTIGLWDVLSPTTWVCKGSPWLSKNDLIHASRTMAKEAGGDLVILQFVGEGFEGTAALQAHGVIIRADPRLAQRRALEDAKPFEPVAPPTDI